MHNLTVRDASSLASQQVQCSSRPLNPTSHGCDTSIRWTYQNPHLTLSRITLVVSTGSGRISPSNSSFSCASSATFRGNSVRMTAETSTGVQGAQDHPLFGRLFAHTSPINFYTSPQRLLHGVAASQARWMHSVLLQWPTLGYALVRWRTVCAFSWLLLESLLVHLYSVGRPLGERCGRC